MSRKKFQKIATILGLGKRLREIRGGESQDSFGKRNFGLGKSTISKFEADIMIPDSETLEKYAILGKTTKEGLLRGEEPQVTKYCIVSQEQAPEIYDASPLTPLADAALTEIIAAVEDYYARHRLKRRPIQKARLIIRLYQHYAETREKPDDILIKGNLPLAD
jgi:transcriptional regulator with XRE-family HTH domain